MGTEHLLRRAALLSVPFLAWWVCVKGVDVVLTPPLSLWRALPGSEG